jgi:molybdopterin adenylyltransferase
MLKVAVITVSDRASRGQYADLSGPRIREILSQRLPGADISLTVVADEAPALTAAIMKNLDITPETCASLCDRAIPGISEWLRRESALETAHAVFSRAYSGMKGNTIIVNFPGSLRGAELCATLMAGIMPHGRDMVHGGGHPSHGHGSVKSD